MAILLILCIFKISVNTEIYIFMRLFGCIVGGFLVLMGLCVIWVWRFVGFLGFGYNFYTKQKQASLLSGAKFVRLVGCFKCLFFREV